MKVFYIHHAERKFGTPPSQNDGITDTGKKEANVVAKLFLEAKDNGINIAAIYTSPYFRCKETAKIINKFINAPIFEDERLNEFVSERQAVKYGLPSDNVETWEHCQMRVISCIKDIVFKHTDDDIVVCVTSGVNLTAFISLAYKIKPGNNLPFPQVPSCSLIGFDITKESFDF